MRCNASSPSLEKKKQADGKGVCIVETPAHSDSVTKSFLGKKKSFLQNTKTQRELFVAANAAAQHTQDNYIYDFERLSTHKYEQDQGGQSVVASSWYS